MQSTSVATHYATPGCAAFGPSPSSLCCTLNAMFLRVSMHRLVLSIEHLSKQLECQECPKKKSKKTYAFGGVKPDCLHWLSAQLLWGLLDLWSPNLQPPFASSVPSECKKTYGVLMTSLQSERKMNHQWCHESKCTDSTANALELHLPTRAGLKLFFPLFLLLSLAQ